jgi:hypothetical protein
MKEKGRRVQRFKRGNKVKAMYQQGESNGRQVSEDEKRGGLTSTWMTRRESFRLSYTQVQLM